MGKLKELYNKAKTYVQSQDQEREETEERYTSQDIKEGAQALSSNDSAEREAKLEALEQKREARIAAERARAQEERQRESRTREAEREIERTEADVHDDATGRDQFDPPIQTKRIDDAPKPRLGERVGRALNKTRPAAAVVGKGITAAAFLPFKAGAALVKHGPKQFKRTTDRVNYSFRSVGRPLNDLGRMSAMGLVGMDPGRGVVFNAPFAPPLRRGKPVRTGKQVKTRTITRKGNQTIIQETVGFQMGSRKSKKGFGGNDQFNPFGSGNPFGTSSKKGKGKKARKSGNRDRIKSFVGW